MAIVHSEGFLEWLKEAGIIPELTRRVVIEADYQNAVTIYAEMYGSDKMVEVRVPQELAQAKVIVLEKPGSEG